MTIFEETAIDEAVERKQPLPPDLAFVCWREARELRAMLEATRKERGELQQMVWRKAK